jgi:hypothetical protein
MRKAAAGQKGIQDGNSRPVAGLADEIAAIVEGEREIRVMQARQLERIARYAANSVDGRLDPDGNPYPYGKYAPEELAVALRITIGAAGKLLELATAAVHRLPSTLSRMKAGDLDMRRVQALADVTRPLPASIASQVEGYVLARAEDRNSTQLRRLATRAVNRFDPDGAERRHQIRRKDRRVEFWPRDDGMAELRAYLTAPDATLIKLRLDAFAKAAPAEDDRTMDQRRADAARDLLLDRAAGPIKTTVHVMVPAGILADTGDTGDTGDAADGRHEPCAGKGPADDRPDPGIPHLAELGGYGTITASQARELAARAGATWHRILTDPVSGTVLDYGRRTYAPPTGLADSVRARDQYCVFPGCNKQSTECDLDHRVPWPEGATSADNLMPLCPRHHRMKHEGGWRVTKRSDGHYVWTSPAEIEYLSRPESVAEADPPPEFDVGAA